jgi:hypothetical protein
VWNNCTFYSKISSEIAAISALLYVRISRGASMFAHPIFRLRGVVAAAFLISLLTCKATQRDATSDREVWLRAPQSHSKSWNREPQLDRIVAGVKLEGMTRAQVLNLFGEPGYSQVTYPGVTRFDEYRLSAKNTQNFRIDYDYDSKVRENMIESSPCSCRLCAADLSAVPSAVLQKSGLLSGKRDETVSPSLTMAVLDKKLGHAGKIDGSRNVAGGQVWFSYSETWRIDGPPNQFLIADGHVPWRDAPTDEVADKPVGSWALITFAPECVP